MSTHLNFHRVATLCTALCLAACSDAPDHPVIEAWLGCQECTEGERAAVAALGSSAVNALERHLKGPSSYRKATVRQQAEDAYDALPPSGASRVAYVDRFVANYIAGFQSRAALSLGDIGGGAARRVLEQALAEATVRGYRDDVRRTISSALARVRLQSTFTGTITPPQAAYGDTVTVAATGALVFANTELAELDGAAFTGTEVLARRGTNQFQFIATGDPGLHTVTVSGIAGSTESAAATLLMTSMTDANDRRTMSCTPPASVGCIVGLVPEIVPAMLPETLFVALQRRQPVDTLDAFRLVAGGTPFAVRATLDWAEGSNLDLRWRRCADLAVVGNSTGATSAKPEVSSVVIPATQCWALLIVMPSGYSERARARLRLDTGPLLTGVSIFPAAPSITVGGTQQLTVVSIDQSGNPIPAVVTWASSNMAVATVNSAGLVTAVFPGTATITATATSAGFSLSASAVVIVP